MARKTKDERLRDVHEEALREFCAIQLALREERMRCLEDRRFHAIAGSQWEGDLSLQFENKPKYEVNLVHKSVRRIFGEYRNNRIDAVFVSKDGSPAGDLPDVCAALYRSDEQDSTAEEAYDNAFDEAVGGGFGAWRLRAEYADANDEDGEDDADEARPQRIKIEPIFDADSSVFFDLNAKRQDKSDARSCYVLTAMTPDEFRRRYDREPANWNKEIHKSEFDWYSPSVVFVAELYQVEDMGETSRIFKGLDESEVEYSDTALEDDPDLAHELEVTGFVEVGQRRPLRRQIHKYLMDGLGIIEDCGRVAGRQIPVVPVYGERCFVDNLERCMGQVRLAKDPQRVLNMLISKLAEMSAISSTEKPIFTPEQINKHKLMWSRENIENYPYMLVEAVMDASGNEALSGPVGFTKPATVPPTLAALLQIMTDALHEILGNPEQAEKMVSHVAGKTVELLQQRLDANSFLFISNFAKAIRRSAQIWLSMSRNVYADDGRKMKGVGKRGEITQIEMRKPSIDPKTKEETLANDLSRAALDVTVTIGPSSESARQSAFQKATGILPFVQDPQIQAVLTHHALMNMDGEGVDDMREGSRRKLLRMGELKPTPEEAQQLAAEAQNAQPTPQDQYLVAEAEKAKVEAEKLRAEVANLRAELALTAARTDKTRADEIATLAEVDLSAKTAAIDTARSLQEMQAASLGQGLGTTAPEGPGRDL